VPNRESNPRSEWRDVSGGDAAVDQERRRDDERRVVAGEERNLSVGAAKRPIGT
jgi:hypothetical protein